MEQEAFANRFSEHSGKGGNSKFKKTFETPTEFKDGSEGCIDNWVEFLKLHLYHDNLNDGMQACTAILSNLGTALKCAIAKREE